MQKEERGTKKFSAKHIIAALLCGGMLVTALMPVKMYAPTHERGDVTVHVRNAENDLREDHVDSSGEAMPAIYTSVRTKK